MEGASPAPFNPLPALRGKCFGGNKNEEKSPQGQFDAAYIRLEHTHKKNVSINT